MAQKRGGGSIAEKTNETQDTLIKNLMIRCKNNGEKSNEDAWQMPEMVGYYNDSSSLPVAPVQSADEAQHLPVKKVVCSPDLPIAEYPPGSRPPLSTATALLTPQEQQINIQCQICHKMYTSKAAYQTHQRTHTRSDAGEDPYRCNICAKTFAVPARLTRHYRTHTGEKPFCCEFCHKSFSVKENLSVHRRIHTKERPYKCEVCSRAFEHSGKLHRHMRIHTGERPHKCTVCSKTFIQSGQLVIHMRTHTGEKPYVCNVCQKGFTCSKQLKVHSRTHTGEKPYSCEICGKSFGYNHVLKLHQVAHYGEKVYKCTICKQDFNSKKSMEAHIKNHNETPPSAPTPPASSCSSSSSSSGSTSDQDNKMDVAESPIPQEVAGYEPEFRYYIYPRSPQYVPQGYGSAGVELLAAAASATERNSDVVFNIITKNALPQEVVTLRHPAYFTTPSQYHPVASEDIRRRVEAAVEAMAVHHMPKEEDPILTPPSSNPVSPAPSVSPVPEHSLPPRKRSKMILKSMEASIDLSPVRLSSVIQYARASS